MIITIPDPLTNLLENRAEQLQVPTDELAVRLLRKALYDEPLTLPAEQTHENFPMREEMPTLEEVVASIRMMPKDPNIFHPATKPVAQLLAELEEHSIAEPDISPEEWDHLWAEFERELKAVDRADDIAEGRL